MPISVLLAAVCVALSVPLLGWALLRGGLASAEGVRDNLLRGLALPAGDGARRPGTSLTGLARTLSSPGTVKRLERLLSRAGRPAIWPMERLLSAKLVLLLTFGVLGLLFVLDGPSTARVFMAVVVTAVAWGVPDLLLLSRGQERQATITLELPDTLDQMTIAVQAGLGFEAAMARAGRTGSGPLAEELVRTLQDIQLGQSRRDAYTALAERTDSTDLRRFLRAVVQAETYGVSISEVLRVQAGEMRLKRRMRAEEKAMQIPVKVIFPLILCILPTLFIVLLGPAVMDIMKAFSGGGL